MANQETPFGDGKATGGVAGMGRQVWLWAGLAVMIVLLIGALAVAVNDPRPAAGSQPTTSEQAAGPATLDRHDAARGTAGTSEEPAAGLYPREPYMAWEVNHGR